MRLLSISAFGLALVTAFLGFGGVAGYSWDPGRILAVLCLMVAVMPLPSLMLRRLPVRRRDVPRVAAKTMPAGPV